MPETIEVLAFTDGAAKGNPGPGGWGAVLLLGGEAVRELGASGGHTTNNRMEMTAVISSLEWIASAAGGGGASITIASDSTYVLRGATEWLRGWKRRGWKTASGEDVANRDLWERLDDAACGCTRIAWKHVPGHAGVPGNERADAIATQFASGRAVQLYEGPYEGYGLDLAAVLHGPVKAASSRSASPGARGGTGKGVGGGRAACYLSLVDGVLLRHATWAECERRVKGRPRARFRKASSPEEEAAILAEWSRSPSPGGHRDEG